MPRANKAKLSKTAHVKAPQFSPVTDFQTTNAQPQELSEKEMQRIKRDRNVAKEIAEREARDTITPYSKSHSRRLKRKEKSALTANLQEVEAVLDEVFPSLIETEATATGQAAPRQKKMTRAKRNKLLAENAKRLPQLLNHPAYKANPFETIRQHALNSNVVEMPLKKSKGSKV